MSFIITEDLSHKYECVHHGREYKREKVKSFFWDNKAWDNTRKKECSKGNRGSKWLRDGGKNQRKWIWKEHRQV